MRHRVQKHEILTSSVAQGKPKVMLILGYGEPIVEELNLEPVLGYRITR